MRQGRIESESEIRFFPLGNENGIGSKSQNENPFCGQSENPFCSSIGNGNPFCSSVGNGNSFCPLRPRELCFARRAAFSAAKVEKESAAGPKLVILHMRRKSR